MLKRIALVAALLCGAASAHAQTPGPYVSLSANPTAKPALAPAIDAFEATKMDDNKGICTNCTLTGGTVSGATLTGSGDALTVAGSPLSALMAGLAKNAPNGVAALDQTGNVTAPILTSSLAVSGPVAFQHITVPSTPLSAVPATPGATIDLAKAVGTVQTHDKSVYVGAIAGAYQLGTAANSANLQATGRGGLFLTTLGLSHEITTDPTAQFQGSPATAQAIINTFSGTGPGMIEGNLDSATTPSVPSADYNYTRTDTWEQWNTQIGWQPSIFLLNMNASGTATTTQYTANDVQDVITGTKDIQSEAPYVKLVLPYLSPNSGVYGSWANDTYWATARSLAVTQGGFAIDVPAGLFLINPSAYQQVVKDQINWARQNNLVVIVLLSPYSTNPADCTVANTCQFSPDPHFMTSSQEVVRQLHNAGADPTIWAVDNYSEQASSPFPGTDDTTSASYNPNTILAVGKWIADNAPTSRYPAAAVGVESAGSVATVAQVTNGYATQTPTLGMLRGAGSMATENSDAVSILGGSASLNTLATISNASVGGNLAVTGGVSAPVGFFLGSLGAQPYINGGAGAVNLVAPSTYITGNANIAGNETVSGNIGVTSTKSLVLGVDLGTNASFLTPQANGDYSFQGHGNATFVNNVTVDGITTANNNIGIADGKSLAFNGSSCFLFHDDAKAGLVLECGSTREERWPDNGTTPIIAATPVVGTP